MSEGTPSCMYKSKFFLHKRFLNNKKMTFALNTGRKVVKDTQNTCSTKDEEFLPVEFIGKIS